MVNARPYLYLKIETKMKNSSPQTRATIPGHSPTVFFKRKNKTKHLVDRILYFGAGSASSTLDMKNLICKHCSNQALLVF